MSGLPNSQPNQFVGAKPVYGLADDFERRFRCLQLAAHFAPDLAIKRAAEFYDFATNKDARTIRETVLDALNEVGVD
jgi:hypothetical protein